MKLDRALNFTPQLWNQVGQFVRGAIKQDALKGIMQDDKRPSVWDMIRLQRILRMV